MHKRPRSINNVLKLDLRYFRINVSNGNHLENKIKGNIINIRYTNTNDVPFTRN